ncbi:flocculation protein FLO11 [Biomphalaria pfeifferi]|uniref:Flocculation protein FLO11 n=1 Tax=Biomphalaria pfeifferi TaxID=112525 RepID=A0AAD8B0V7_BIOPF|nr:flocculation protein FLO11 [Biomphalaria pfeifferi]
MNPLKVKWFRTSAKARVCYAWILVRLGIHRRAPVRFRAIFSKASDWLEATVEQVLSGTAMTRPHLDLSHAMTSVHTAYNDLQQEMAALHSGKKNLKESVENVKVKFLDLLDVCGIKDADIPLFEELHMRHKHQTLITSFGIMFKGSSHMNPQRINRQARCNPTIYADMLIEQLLAQAGSNDSDSSSPPAIDSTPELPISESSGSLDVQFASLFDMIESDLPTTTSNSFSTSDGYPKASETSPDIPLPSREEELRERDAYYCDITIDRQHKIEDIKSPLSQQSYTVEIPDASKLLVRTVEGAESSPKNVLFQTPRSCLRAPRSFSHKYRVSPIKSPSMRRQHQFYSNITSSSSYSSSEQTPRRYLHYYNQKSASYRSCTTHPIASSTILMDSDSSSPAGSVYTWSIDDDSSPNNLEKSYIRSTSEKKKIHKAKSSSHSFKYIRASDPNVSIHDASHSLVPSDTDSTSELHSEFSPVDRPYITGKSSTSDSSLCTAARCRPRRTCEKVTIVEDTLQPNQELLDSILTDSPKSVDSSGIFVPHNSYTSAVESVGSHNGCSSTVSSCFSSDSNKVRKTPGCKAPPPHTRNTCTYIAPCPSKSTPEELQFKRPFTPAPHIDHTVRICTRNQGVTTDTPHRPASVRTTSQNRHSLFVVPPGVITGPPKIKDKKSIVKKLKQFSSHFYRKTEKIKTLANL